MYSKFCGNEERYRVEEFVVASGTLQEHSLAGPWGPGRKPRQSSRPAPAHKLESSSYLLYAWWSKLWPQVWGFNRYELLHEAELWHKNVGGG